MAQIFISFIHEEEPYASCLQSFIQAAFGFRVRAFLSTDKWAIYAGESWLDRIVQELQEAKVVVAMLSPESVKRPWVNFESGAAYIKQDCKLIPVCFNGLAKGALPQPYASLQAVDLTDLNDQCYLIRSLAHYLGVPEPPSPYEGPPPRRGEDLAERRPEYSSLKRCLEMASLVSRPKELIGS